MARPTTDEMQWFKHYTGEASEDEDMRDLLEMYGAEGYAVYFITLEHIYGTHENQVTEGFIRRISRRSYVSVNRIKQIYRFCAKIGLFDATTFKKDKVLISERIENEVDQCLAKRKNGRERVKRMKEDNSKSTVCDDASILDNLVAL